MQLGKQPPLFECRFSFRRAQRSVQDERLGFVHIPNRGAHRVVPQALECPDSLVAVDDQKPVRFLRESNDHDGDLLPTFGKRGQQAAFPIGTAHPKPFMAQVELMKLQVHVTAPRCRFPCSDPI